MLPTRIQILNHTVKNGKNLFNFGSVGIDVETPISNLQSGFRPSVNKLTRDCGKVFRGSISSTYVAFLHAQDEMSFIGSQCLANGKQIWQKVC